MGYTLKGLDKLELSEGFQYILKELDAFDGDTFKGKVHSSQLLPRKEINPKDIFVLRRNDKDTINIKDLTICKSQSGSMNDSFISFRFIIPAFQRGYRWETEHVHDLLEDIYINYKKYYNPKLPEETESYCIQPLVLKQSTGFLNEYRVIDGQQRLTTITLLLEALNNQVPEEFKFHAFIPISYETRPESEKFLYKVGEVCKNAIKSVKENCDTTIPLEERVEKTREKIEQQPKDLNSRYMLNTYLYAYWYFWEIITGNRKDYFEFAEAGWDKGEDWKPKRFALIEKMLLKATSVIWYTIDNDNENKQKVDEHKVFEDFNSGKISLTCSELVKGVFMNPDNYINNYQDYSFTQLKTNQAMLGGQWDDMEKTLHNNEFWSFIPHQEDGAGEIDKSTHIDSILNMYVFFNIMCGKNVSKIINEDLFTYKEINKKIKEINKKTKEKQINSEDKFKSMWEFWLEIKNVYTTFHEWFIGDNSLKNINSLYHRISLFKRIFFNKQDSYTQRYQKELSRLYPLYNKLTRHDKKAREKLLNIEIAKELLDNKTDEPKREDIENFIKTRTYDENGNDVKVILLAFNLSTLEGAKAYGGRFPFDIFDKEKWNKEHIFATNTALSGEENEEKELYDALVSENEMNSYVEYHLLINKPERELYEKTIEEINSIINGQVSGSEKDSLNTRLLGADGDILVNILRDNHMGNMALLTERDNISISNDSYKDKSGKIKEWFKEGDFIPICTMNVFSDFYSDDDGYSTHWLYAKRLSYLKQIIKSVNNYLFGDEDLKNE